MLLSKLFLSPKCFKEAQAPHLLQQICLLDGFQDVFLRRLLSLASQQELVQDEIRLLEVKDDIQLADLSLWRSNRCYLQSLSFLEATSNVNLFSAAWLTLPKYCRAARRSGGWSPVWSVHYPGPQWHSRNTDLRIYNKHNICFNALSLIQTDLNQLLWVVTKVLQSDFWGVLSGF